MMTRQQQIERLIEEGIQCRLFQRMERQPRLIAPRVASWQKWQKMQADSLLVRKRLQQLLGIEGDSK